jgi:hypothetical protein
MAPPLAPENCAFVAVGRVAARLDISAQHASDATAIAADKVKCLPAIECQIVAVVGANRAHVGPARRNPP